MYVVHSWRECQTHLRSIRSSHHVGLCGANPLFEGGKLVQRHSELHGGTGSTAVKIVECRVDTIGAPVLINIA